jgi:hypothetical protein
MDAVATHRRRSDIRIRGITDLAYRGAGMLLKLLTREGDRVTKNVLYYPTVKDVSTLADLANRASWYFPVSTFSEVSVFITVDTKLLGTDLKSLEPPICEQNYISKSGNIHLIDSHVVNLSQADAIMLWDKRSMFDLHLLRHLSRLNIVDPEYFLGVDSETHRKLYAHTIQREQKERFLELSKKNYQALLDDVAGYGTAYVFGTGPSLDRATEFDYRGGFCIVCNSIVKNKALLRHIRPQLLVCADPVFHMSPCRYSAEFRRMLLEIAMEFHCYIMLPDYNLGLYLAHYPELKSKIIGMPIRLGLREIITAVSYTFIKVPIKVPAGGCNFPTLERFYVRSSANIMTLLMLPVASSAATKIYIIGADGRKPDEEYFWTHSSSSQLGDLMQTAFDTHPSFLRDHVYADYYDEHCKVLERLVHYGESLGKKYYALTPSYIPVLAQRPAMR